MSGEIKRDKAQPRAREGLTRQARESLVQRVRAARKRLPEPPPNRLARVR
jgi:hypothetical protein